MRLNLPKVRTFPKRNNPPWKMLFSNRNFKKINIRVQWEAGESMDLFIFGTTLLAS